MRIVFSRKGMDSDRKNGGIPSPVIDERLVMLPIPTDERLVTYSALRCHGYSLGQIVTNLTNGRITAGNATHLDPDLNAKAQGRPRGWRPIFGQTGAAASHLQAQGVTVGDIFLFFGWFRTAERKNGCFAYKRDCTGFHSLLGWLQVGAVIDCSDSLSAAFVWARSHPHVCGEYGTLYIAAEHLTMKGLNIEIPGAGIFERYSESLMLTWPGKSRSMWRMPQWFFPRNGCFPLTYHVDRSRYRRLNAHVLLQTVAKGQEFILDTKDYPEAIGWARGLIITGTRSGSV